MKMQSTILAFVSISLSATGLLAHPTGAALMFYPVQPCRFMDTRVSNAPLMGQTGMYAFVRGSNLSASDGAKRADCDIPLNAEAVVVNLSVVNPTTTSHLLVNGVGSILHSNGIYSRMLYRIGEVDNEEMTVSLCNTFDYPAPHQPCPYDGVKYSDFQISNEAYTGSSVHIVGDVVGYYARLTGE
jgi:hypothetical protein